MRSRVKKPRSGERVNYLASVSDLMSGLLFVFILALTVAIIQTKFSAKEAQEATARAREEAARAQEATARAEEATERAKEAAIQMEGIQARLKNVEARLVGTREATGNLLDRLQKELVKENVTVEIDPARSVLRIPENAVSFEVGRSDLNEENAERIRMIGRVLADKLLCYQKNVPDSMRERCAAENPHGHTLDAVFIEGHTDNLAYKGDETGRRNRYLSTARSNEVYGTMVVENEALGRLTNPNGESLFSLSGYGSARPIAGHRHEVPTDDPANRRIEFRFIMTAPAFSEEEEELIRRESESPS